MTWSVWLSIYFCSIAFNLRHRLLRIIPTGQRRPCRAFVGWKVLVSVMRMTTSKCAQYGFGVDDVNSNLSIYARDSFKLPLRGTVRFSQPSHSPFTGRKGIRLFLSPQACGHGRGSSGSKGRRGHQEGRQ